MNDKCRTCRDSSELLQRERVRASLAEAREKAKDRLVGIAAAESSAMANSLLGWTAALRRDFAQQAARGRALDLMEARIAAHLTVLETLLDASSTSFGGELSLVRLNLRDVVEGAMFSQRAFAVERGVHLPGLHPVNADAVVLGDRERVARALRDLLAECIRAAATGSALDVELTADPVCAGVRLRIKRMRVSLDEASLGIAAARRAVAVHGGSLELLDDGLSLRLPFFDPDRAALAAPAAAAKTLLVVRHEPEIAEMLALLATARGYRVLTVQDEELAARAFEVHDPDLVVLGDPEALERMRALLPRGVDRLAVVSSAAQASALLGDMTVRS